MEMLKDLPIKKIFLWYVIWLWWPCAAAFAVLVPPPGKRVYLIDKDPSKPSVIKELNYENKNADTTKLKDPLYEAKGIKEPVKPLDALIKNYHKPVSSTKKSRLPNAGVPLAGYSVVHGFGRKPKKPFSSGVLDIKAKDQPLKVDYVKEISQGERELVPVK